MLNNSFLRKKLFFLFLFAILGGKNGHAQKNCNLNAMAHAPLYLENDFLIDAAQLAFKSCGFSDGNFWQLDCSGFVGDSIIAKNSNIYEISISFSVILNSGSQSSLSFSFDSLQFKKLYLKDLPSEGIVSFFVEVDPGQHVFRIDFDSDRGTSSIQLKTLHFQKHQNPFLDLAEKYASSMIQTIPDPGNYSLMDWRIVNLLIGFEKLYEVDPNPLYLSYIKKWAEKHIREDGSYDHPINDVFPGALIVWLEGKTKDIRYRRFIEDTKNYLKVGYPKNEDGIYFHVRDEIWDDTIAGITRFLVALVKFELDSSRIDQAAYQFVGHARILQDKNTGLFFHAYDTDGSQYWADPISHLSPEFWARGNGWILQALADLLDVLPPSDEYRSEILHIRKNIIAGLLRFQDKNKFLWKTVLGKPNYPGNYFENSAACLYLYGLEKMIRSGSLDWSLAPNIKEIWKNLFTYIYGDSETHWYLSQVSKGTGPGNYENYISIPIGNAAADYFGAGLFLEALIERYKMEHVQHLFLGKIIYYQNEQPVPNVSVYVRSRDQMYQTMTDRGGIFQFDYIQGSDILLSFSKPALSNADFILMYDAALAARYSIGLQPLSNFQKLAADVSGDGEIQMYDAGQIARFSVGLFSPGQPRTGQWGFIPNAISISPDAGDNSLQVLAFVYGDLHGGWHHSEELQKVVSPSMATFFRLKNSILECQLPLTKITTLFSFTAKWEYNPEYLEYIGASLKENPVKGKLFSAVHAYGVKLGAYWVNGYSTPDTVVIRWRLHGSKNIQPPKLSFFSINGKRMTPLSDKIMTEKNVSLKTGLEFSIYPNPFNTFAVIEYNVKSATILKLQIFNMKGQRVRILKRGFEEKGYHRFIWDGRDEWNNEMASGVYFVTLTLPKNKYSKKLILLK